MVPMLHGTYLTYDGTYHFYLLFKLIYRKRVILQYPHSFCGYGTHSIVTIKCNISTIIYDVDTIQCDIGTFWFFIYINLNNKQKW